MAYRFADKFAFEFLWLIPLILFVAWWRLRGGKAHLERILGKSKLSFLAQSVSWNKRRAKVILQVVAIFFFVIALARPQSGEGRQKAKREGLEMILAIDVSNSMLAEDVRPSRLDLVKAETSRFLDLIGGDKVGLIAFAGSAITLSPLTTDKSALNMYIDSLTPETVSTQGTDFGRALSEAYQDLKRGGLDSDDNTSITKVIVLISDGENHDPKDLAIARKIAGDGIRIYTLGVGTAKGAPIPLRDDHGNLIGYKKDQKGQVVLSRSIGESLEQIAAAGKGTFHHLVFGGNTTKTLRNELEHLQRAQLDETEITSYNENYQLYLFIGIVAAMGGLFLGERKGEGRLWSGRFEVKRS